jgi:hypothetical protein
LSKPRPIISLDPTGRFGVKVGLGAGMPFDALAPDQIRSGSARSDFLRAASQVEAQLRDSIAALQASAPRADRRTGPAKFARRRVSGRALPQAIREVGMLLVLDALADQADSIAVRAGRLSGSEPLGLFLSSIDGLGRLILKRLDLVMRAYAEGRPLSSDGDDAVTQAVEDLVSRLMGCMTLRPGLAPQCIELFAVVKALESAADLIGELRAMSFAAPAGAIEVLSVPGERMRGAA